MGWALAFCVAVGLGVAALRDFAGDRSAVTQIGLCVLALAFAAVVWLGQIRFEIALADSHLVLRNRPLFGRLLNWPWTERVIARGDIHAFWLDRNPWVEQKRLMVLLDDGSSLAILAPRASDRSAAFDSFVASFRSFAGGDTDSGTRTREVRKGWRFPVVHALVGGVVVACGGMMVWTAQDLWDQKAAMIIIIPGVMLAVAGFRLFLERV